MKGLKMLEVKTVVLSASRVGKELMKEINAYAEAQDLNASAALRRLLADILPTLTKSCKTAKERQLPGQMSTLGTMALVERVNGKD